MRQLRKLTLCRPKPIFGKMLPVCRIIPYNHHFKSSRFLKWEQKVSQYLPNLNNSISNNSDPNILNPMLFNQNSKNLRNKLVPRHRNRLIQRGSVNLFRKTWRQ
jgi:hypothetical protein